MHNDVLQPEDPFRSRPPSADAVESEDLAPQSRPRDRQEEIVSWLQDCWIWTAETIRPGQSESRGELPRGVANLFSRLMMRIFDPNELSESPRRSAEAQEGRGRLTGEEATDTLVRWFAAKTNRPVTQFEDGIRGSLDTVERELREWADYCCVDRDLLVALFRGIIPQTLRRLTRTRGANEIQQVSLVLQILDRVHPQNQTETKHRIELLAELAKRSKITDKEFHSAEFTRLSGLVTQFRRINLEPAYTAAVWIQHRRFVVLSNQFVAASSRWDHRQRLEQLFEEAKRYRHILSSPRRNDSNGVTEKALHPILERLGVLVAVLNVGTIPKTNTLIARARRVLDGWLDEGVRRFGREHVADGLNSNRIPQEYQRLCVLTYDLQSSVPASHSTWQEIVSAIFVEGSLAMTVVAIEHDLAQYAWHWLRLGRHYFQLINYLPIVTTSATRQLYEIRAAVSLVGLSWALLPDGDRWKHALDHMYGLACAEQFYDSLLNLGFEFEPGESPHLREMTATLMAGIDTVLDPSPQLQRRTARLKSQLKKCQFGFERPSSAVISQENLLRLIRDVYETLSTRRDSGPLPPWPFKQANDRYQDLGSFWRRLFTNTIDVLNPFIIEAERQRQQELDDAASEEDEWPPPQAGATQQSDSSSREPSTFAGWTDSGGYIKKQIQALSERVSSVSQLEEELVRKDRLQDVIMSTFLLEKPDYSNLLQEVEAAARDAVGDPSHSSSSAHSGMAKHKSWKEQGPLVVMKDFEETWSSAEKLITPVSLDVPPVADLLAHTEFDFFREV